MAPAYPYLPSLDSSSSESKSEYKVEVDLEGESEWSMAEEVVSSETVDLRVCDIAVFEHWDSDSEVLETPCILMVDLITESEADREEVEILEPQPVLVVDLVTDNEEEIALSLTLPQGEVVPVDTSEDIKSKMELLEELDCVNPSWEEYQELARVRGKRVLAWRKEQRTAKGTYYEPRASPGRPSEEPKYFAFLNRSEPDPTKRTRGFYVLSLIPDRQD
jgi:hypothetical protein